MKNPVLFIHGIGASGKVWKKFEIPRRNSYYLSFSNCFADPQSQVPELKSEIDGVLKLEKKDKVVLVCHSMGGLSARRYLIDYRSKHRVEKLILFSTPNLGSVGLSFNWFPALMIIVGLLGFSLVWPFVLALIGLIWEIISYFRGVLLLSPAAWAMRPGSKFLEEINAQKLPNDIKYVVVLSDTKDLPHRLVNLFLFREGGDGAVPISSQRLSQKCVPNFSELDYSELKTNLPHFEIPKKVDQFLLPALEL